MQFCACAALKIWTDRMKRKQRKFGDRVQLVVDEMLHMLGHSSFSSAAPARTVAATDEAGRTSIDECFADGNGCRNRHGDS